MNREQATAKAKEIVEKSWKRYEKTSWNNYLFHWKHAEELIAQALIDASVKWPSEDELLRANHKYVEANWMKHDPRGSLSHAYFHGQTDLIEWFKNRKREKK